MSNLVRWGTIGTQPFLVEHCFPEISTSGRAVITAVASRSIARARAVADAIGGAKACGYEELLADPAVDLVYITLPTGMHVKWTLKALAAGKHVLCEKPIAPSGLEAAKLAAEASRYSSFVFEAYMWKYHPQWAAVLRRLKVGDVGQPVLCRCHFGYLDDDRSRVRNTASAGAGVLSMIGCYPVAFAKLVFQGQDVKTVSATAPIDPVFGVERLVSCVLEFDQGRAEFSVSSRTFDYQMLAIHCTRGVITMNVPVTPGAAEVPRILVTTAAGVERLPVPAASQYALQADSVSAAVLSNTRPALDDGIHTLEVLDAVREAARLGRLVDLTA